MTMKSRSEVTCMQSSVEQYLAHWPAHVLSIAAKGGIDIQEAAHYELAMRGFSAGGEFVGSEPAMTEYLVQWG